jgi:hypothetical protein
MYYPGIFLEGLRKIKKTRVERVFVPTEIQTQKIPIKPEMIPLQPTLPVQPYYQNI